jgi:hypothetical protein
MSLHERFSVWSTHRNCERTHHEPVDGSLDRVEDPVAVLCHRSCTDRATKLARDAFFFNYRWAPPANSKSLPELTRQIVPPKHSITKRKSHSNIKWEPPLPTSRNNKKRSNAVKHISSDFCITSSSCPCPSIPLDDNVTSDIVKKKTTSFIGNSRSYTRRMTSTRKPQETIPHDTRFQSRTSSSLRTQAASDCLRIHRQMLPGHVLKKQNHRTNLKTKKLKPPHFIEVVVPRSFDSLKWTMQDLSQTELVFDGGNPGSVHLRNPGENKPINNWKSLRISDGELFVADTTRYHMGIVHHDSNGDPVFIRVPRKAALEMTGMNDASVVRQYCSSLRHAEKVQKSSLFRSHSKKIYSDSKYCCVGVQPCRAQRGVREATYHKDRIPKTNWDNLVQTLTNVEDVMSAFVPTDELRKVNLARELIDFKTMSSDDKLCKIFGSIAFGRNVHLACHTDKDFAKSVVSVYLDDDGYGFNDRIIAYFCFPRLGIAVALRAGDILIFNPSEPHAVSSRTDQNDDVYCVSMYLKTAVVSLNDNSIPITNQQKHYLRKK